MEPKFGRTRNLFDILPQEKHDTFILSKEHTLRRTLGLSTSASTNQTTHLRQEVILLIRGVVERVTLDDQVSIILGRDDLRNGFRPDLDLTPYGAYTRGVSRSHARLHLENRQLYITDLGSANGTFIANERLAPNEPRLLRHGDQLLLGSLGVSIAFD